jgi:hypothetical protein
MNPAEAVITEVECQCRPMVFKLLAEGIRQARQPLAPLAD